MLPMVVAAVPGARRPLTLHAPRLVVAVVAVRRRLVATKRVPYGIYHRLRGLQADEDQVVAKHAWQPR